MKQVAITREEDENKTELVIGWRPRVNCGRGEHGGAMLVFLNIGLGLGGLLELLEKVDDSVDALANVDDALEEDVRHSS
jgi:hypothetical protein